MHNLLKRQLKKFIGNDTVVPEELRAFVSAINESYEAFESDEKILHRAMELSSEELTQANSELRVVFHAIPDLILKFDSGGNIVALKAIEDVGFTTAEGISPRRTISNRISQLPNSAIREQFHNALQELFRNNEAQTFEYSTPSEFGDSYYEVRLIPLMKASAIAIVQDITTRKQAIIEREELNQQLIKTSRQAGMAEVATGVLHNVGNVLNSVNVSASLLRNNVNKSQIQNLVKATNLLRDHAADTIAFLTSDPKGQKLPGYLIKLGDHLATEQRALQLELEGLGKNIEHIKEIVAMQQSYARLGGVSEALNAAELVEDALRMNKTILNRSGIVLVRDFQDVPPVGADKHKVLQILTNLICNATHAISESGKSEKIITLSIHSSDDKRVRIQVQDNGSGIAPENLARIFQHGFTTKRDGHGFGLHSGANAAKEMGGRFSVHSDGLGCGAVFTLELSVANSPTRPAPKPSQLAQPETEQKL